MHGFVTVTTVDFAILFNFAENKKRIRFPHVLFARNVFRRGTQTRTEFS